MKGIINGKIILEDEIVLDKVLLYDEKIIDIVDKEDVDLDDISLIDARGMYVSPGFIDIHIHGSAGKDTMDGNVESIAEISRDIVKSGVTSFLPATMTMDFEYITNALESIRKAVGKDFGGANVLGTYLEGPFISEKYKGAQDAKYIIKPNLKLIENYLDIIKVVVLAPEEDEEYNFIKEIRSKHENITLSIGHSNATFEQAREVIKLGVSNTTHTFNAMTPLHHRKPGIVGAALSLDITCEIIADNIHVHPGLYQFIVDSKGVDNVVLITDSMRAGGLDEGRYDLGGQEVIVDDKSARLEDGTLAGSILRMNIAVKNIYNNTSLKLNEVIRMASLNPARVIRQQDEKGSIDIHKDADLIIFDEDINICKTIIKGKLIIDN